MIPSRALPLLLLLLPVAAAYDDRCCFVGQPVEPADNACSSDAFCAGSEEYECGATKDPKKEKQCGDGAGGVPNLECQNCGCCPCCSEGHVCCKLQEAKKTNAVLGRSFRSDVTGQASPDFNGGECRPECSNNCNGHGSCETNTNPNACPRKSCVCDPPGFDPDTSCQFCLPTSFGPNCTACPGITAPGKGTAPAETCNGHGSCDGQGTSFGTGKCACLPGWKGDGCGVFFCPGPNGTCVHGACVAPDNLHPVCVCEKGWQGDACATPKCPQPGSPEDPGCIHGNCSGGSVQHCLCDSGWGGARCDVPICTQGCVVGQGTCVSPNDCTCAKGYSGDDCGTAICTKPCVRGQGDCTAPDHCTCRPGNQGLQCEVANAACCFTKGCGQSPTSCGDCCAYPKGFKVPNTEIVGCAGDSYVCRGCDCMGSCCHGGGYCSGSGTASGKGKCCGNHREGSQCDRCVAGYWGGNCSACPGLVDRSATGESNIICSGHGACNQGLAGNGSCTCETGFNGADCGSCEASFCPNQCSSHGACECSEGKKPTCKCDGGWGGDNSCGTCEEGLAGKDCGTCAAGWYGGTAAAKAGASLQCKKCACVLGTCDEGTHGTGICSTGVPPAAIIGGVAGAVIIGAIVVYVLFCKKKDAHAAPMLREPMMGAGPMAGIQQQQPAHVPVPPPAGSMAVPPPFVPAQQQQQQPRQ